MLDKRTMCSSPRTHLEHWPLSLCPAGQRLESSPPRRTPLSRSGFGRAAPMATPSIWCTFSLIKKCKQKETRASTSQHRTALHSPIVQDRTAQPTLLANCARSHRCAISYQSFSQAHNTGPLLCSFLQQQKQLSSFHSLPSDLQ